MKKLLLLFALTGCATSHPSVDGLYIDDGGRGTGVPVMFVHGNGGNSNQWRAQLSHVRRERRAVAFDLRGMGRSQPAANGDYSVAAMASDIGRVADALHLQRFVLVGHSYGGAVVAKYAAEHPERVAGVVFADAAGNVNVSDAGAAKFIAALRKDKDAVARVWFAPILKPSAEAVQKEVFASVHDTSVDALTGALSGMRDVDMRALLDAYHGPRVAIVAADIENPSSLHVQFPKLAKKKIRGAGHWLMLDKPDEFNALLDEFLHSVDAVRK